MAPSSKRRLVAWLPAGPLLALALSAAVRPALATPGCDAWPGELAPLPDVHDADPLAARWAHERAARLGALAAELEAADPDAAARLRVHALCLDPSRATDRTALGLQPLRRSAPRPMLRAVPESRLATIDEGLAAATRDLEAARFRKVLDREPRLRRMLAALESAPAVLRRQAALELLVATAYTALGREDEATHSMTRALDAEPRLKLGPGVSPKLERLLLRARTPRSGSR